MRVNMDSSVTSDPRFKQVARELGVDWKQVAGECFLVWLACYDRRSICLTADEIDIAAEHVGFADAFVKFGLAHRREGSEAIEIHGVEIRIDFLNEQAKKGRKGGKQKAKNSLATGKAKAKESAKARREAKATGSVLAYTHAPDQSLTQDQDTNPQTPKGDVEIVVEYLNTTLGRSGASCFRAEGNTRKLIEERLADGHAARELRMVCWHKHREWNEKEDMAQFLRPSTLFRKSKFEEYLPSAQAEIAAQERDKPDPHKVSREDYKPLLQIPFTGAKP